MYIGQISELSGYSQRMIRYLEDQGLVVPDRSDSNLRRFSDQDLTRILKIKKLKELGFTYPEIKDLIDKDEHVLAGKGGELLKRHHAEAQELLEKIQQLEMICYGETKTAVPPEIVHTLVPPTRTAYRIKKLEAVAGQLEALAPELKCEVVLWKFGSFLSMQEFQSGQNVKIVEIFRGSSQIAILVGECRFHLYEKAWTENSLPFNSNPLGTFAAQELELFFGKYEIVIEHKLLAPTGELLFHALLPYQAIYIASGESLA
ncbi:MAG: MerR family transcriptional regulator [Bdellovibrionales bacterium]|nr:MerR family transcriptional regulator [Bdellovibrionales bacterium]